MPCLGRSSLASIEKSSESGFLSSVRVSSFSSVLSLFFSFRVSSSSREGFEFRVSRFLSIRASRAAIDSCGATGKLRWWLLQWRPWWACRCHRWRIPSSAVLCRSVHLLHFHGLRLCLPHGSCLFGRGAWLMVGAQVRWTLKQLGREDPRDSRQRIRSRGNSGRRSSSSRSYLMFSSVPGMFMLRSCIVSLAALSR